MAGCVLVTGASGFVGQALVPALAARGYHVKAASRRPNEHQWRDVAGIDQVRMPDLAALANWDPLLEGVTHVVHTAGLAHADGQHDLATYRQINTDATLRLAMGAKKAGIDRFVYLSSIRAQSGPSSPVPLDEACDPEPTDDYGLSKLLAEHALALVDRDWIALRPVLVYGPGVKANMAALMKLARTPLPLPFGALRAERSLLSIRNLCSAVSFALSGACPVKRCFIVSDPEPVTLPQMITALRAGMGRGAGLFSVPESLLRAGLGLAGRAAMHEKLAGGLVARPTALRLAGWQPEQETSQALQELARLVAGSAVS
jgi:nucleoside-diphosphate-sugar epimerase